MSDKPHSPRVAEEVYTANLISVYNTPNLVAYLTSAERFALEQQILQRIGAKHA